MIADAEDGLIRPSGPSLGFEAERNSAVAMGVLHFCVIFAFPLLIWDSPELSNRRVVLWGIGQAVLAASAFLSAWHVHNGRIEQYRRRTTVGSVGTAIAFGALPWLGENIAGANPSKFVLFIAAIAFTSISASNSAQITSNRRYFRWHVTVVAISYSIAFGTHGEMALALLTVLWCLAIAALTGVGHRAVLDLIKLRRESEESARHDDLTGLLSRSAFFEALASSRLNTSAPTLVLFDLDGFKAINDSFGHAVGDRVLQAVADRLPNYLPAHTQFGRIGGDEFAAVLPSSLVKPGHTVDQALLALTDPIHVDDLELFIAASAGWTIVDPTVNSAELMAQADAALYHSKRSSISEGVGFTSHLQHEMDRSVDLRQRFRSALMKSEIRFHSQPLVRLSDRRPVAVELLARWPQADDSIIPPTEFTSVADDIGLAVELDCQALTAAAALLANWESDDFLRTLVVKVNISPIHLRNDQLVANVRRLIPKHHWNRLGLELVESQLISAATQNRSQLQTLLDMGVTLSIDDFGVGYSSLTYLRFLPVSELKIDRSFITAMDSDPVNRALIRAIVDIASTLGLPTVAEGVETEEEFEAARGLGLDDCQGFLIGHPGALDQSSLVLQQLYQQSLDSLDAA